jgi:hypothetical protein
LQLAAFGVPMLILTLAMGSWIAGSPPFPHLFGDDLVPSYMAGTFVREGHAEKLMDPAAAARFQANLRRQAGLEQHGRTGPWLNPPFFAAFFAPLSTLPYRAALWTWFGLNVAMLAASIALLYRMLPADRRRPGDAAIIAGLLVGSMPALQAMACQQNTFLSLLIFCAAVTLWRSDRLVLAGVVAGLLAFKPQLALLTWAAMGLLVGRRAIAGIVATAIGLVLFSELAIPGGMLDYARNLLDALPYQNAGKPYAWARQVTLQGFVRVLLDPQSNPAVQNAKLAWLALLAVAAGLTIRTLIQGAKRGGASALGRDRCMAMSIAAMPLLMPYYMDYDLLLLAVPAVLLAAERLDGHNPRRVVVGVWALFYAALYFNTAVAEASRVSLAVVLLVALGAVHATALRRQRNIDEPKGDETASEPLRAAA